MGLTLGDLTPDWAAGVCRDLVRAAPDDEVRVHDLAVAELGGGQGVISRYEKSTDAAIVGHRMLTIRWSLRGTPREDRLVLKSKVPGATIRRRLEEVYRRFDPRLCELMHALSPSILDDLHVREPEIYRLDHAALRSVTPAIARVWTDPVAQIFAVVMELLDDVRHARTLDDLDVWLASDIECALVDIAGLHGAFLGKISGTAPPPWLVPFDRLNNAALLAYEAGLLRYNAEAFPDLYDARRVRLLESFLASAADRHRRLLARPLTLVHGDLTPRNICLRRGEPMRLCAYDWELAQVHLPQRDVCELLCYVLDPKRGWKHEGARALLGRYRVALEAASGAQIDDDAFREDLRMAFEELCTFKLLVQGITHQLLGNRRYFERIVHNAFAGLEETSV